VLEDQWNTDASVFEQPATLSYVETRGSTRQANTDDPIVFAASVLACCRGVSVSIAQDLLRAFGSLQGIIAAEEKDLATTKIGQGKQTLGKVRAERLHRLLHATVDVGEAKVKASKTPNSKAKEKPTVTNPMALLED
jgi:hypothetical protein